MSAVRMPSGFSWRRVMALYRPYRAPCAAIVSIIVAGAAVNVAVPLLARALVDRALPRHDARLLIELVAAMLAVSTVAACLALVEGRLSVDVGEGILRDVREALMRRLVVVPMAFFRRTSQGTIVNRLVADVDNIEDVALGALSGLAKQAVQFVVSAVMMVVVDVRLASLALLIIAGNVLSAWSGARRQYDARRRTREMRDDVENLTQEALSYSGVALMKAYNQEQRERQRHAAATDRLCHAEIGLAMSGRYVMLSVTLIRVFGLAAVWLLGASFVFAGTQTLGSLIAFTVYLTTFYTATETSSAMNIQLSAIRALFERIFEFLDEPAERRTGAERVPAGPCEVRFDGVVAGYDGAAPALRIDRLRIAPGETVALVGASGAGKSTLAAALLRLVELRAGSITLGGVALGAIAEDSLREAISVVPQEPVILNATLRENVAYGRAGVSDEEIVAALEAAALGPFLRALPRGLDAELGEAGSSVSAGERQRISIARALLRRPGLLIYDEATSALDAAAESRVVRTIAGSRGERTNLIIAHRYTTVEHCDRVIVLERGCVAEQGTVTDLLAHGGIFAAQYWAQFAAEAVTA
jgi:ATP-binding cassette, subfamily B, bacterial